MSGTSYRLLITPHVLNLTRAGHSFGAGIRFLFIGHHRLQEFDPFPVLFLFFLAILLFVYQYIGIESVDVSHENGQYAIPLIVHLISAGRLSNIFKFVGNTAYEVALRGYPQLRVSATHVRLPSLEPEECRAIIEKAATLDDGDWFTMVRYAVVVFAFCSGLRSKELRLCDVNCIHMRDGTWTVEVHHPKGEGKYGETREAPIHPDAYPFLTRYFAARAQHVREMMSPTHALFLGSVCTDGYLATNTVRAYADYVSKDLGIDVDLRKCRRTYGQRLIDLKVPVSVVSVAMGHKSTRTTEQHYARVKGQTAIEDISRTFANMDSLKPDYTDSQLPKGFELRREAPGKDL